MNDLQKPRFRDILFDYRRCGDIKKAMLDIDELRNEVWNEAIEAAAKYFEDNIDDPGLTSKDIRKLKNLEISRQWPKMPWD